VCRFFVGLCCSATLAINGGSVRDQFRPVKRSFVFPVIAWVNVAGEILFLHEISRPANVRQLP
jgi:DHA1 family multidrug resistance protein-like MFS transporter